MLFISNFATAQQSQVKLECNEPLMMGPLCMSVEGRIQDSRDDSPFEYTFEEHIYNLACVNVSTDSPSVINKKIQAFWIKYEKELVCDSTGFNVPKGNILKMAAHTLFSQFLDKAVYDWKVPLNKVDPSDGRTTLDYIKDEIIKNKGQPNEKPLQSYYDLLRRNGAKHKSEL